MADLDVLGANRTLRNTLYATNSTNALKTLSILPILNNLLGTYNSELGEGGDPDYAEDIISSVFSCLEELDTWLDSTESVEFTALSINTIAILSNHTDPGIRAFCSTLALILSEVTRTPTLVNALQVWSTAVNAVILAELRE